MLGSAPRPNSADTALVRPEPDARWRGVRPVCVSVCGWVDACVGVWVCVGGVNGVDIL